MLSLLLNIIWIVFGGFFIFLEYFLTGILLCITIIGIPFGYQCFKLSILALMPFGKEIQTDTSFTGFFSIVFNILWIITFGLIISITHVILAIIFAITIIGIPFARQHIKLAALALTPFGAKIK